MLKILRDRQAYLELGWIRLGDYAAECLGLSLRTVQDLIRTEETLAALPSTAAAFDAGHVSAAHVRILGRVATAGDEKAWLARARRMDLRSLRRTVTAALAREKAAGRPGTASGGGAGLPLEKGSQHPDSMRASGVATSGDDQAGPPRRAEEDGDDEPELKPLTVSAPVWVIGWWRDAVTLAGRLAGSSLPHGAALEIVLAESRDVIGAGADSPWRSGADRAADGSTPVETENGLRRLSRETPQVAAAGEGGVQGDAAPRSEGSSGGAPQAGPSPGARALDAELRRLVTERQRLEASLAERLGMDRAAGAHLLEGGGSLERYAARRYGISPRRIYYLLSLQRTLERLSALRRAYISGRLTLRQTILVGKVATRRTAPAWIRRAERITLRRLEDEVEYWELLRVERPEVWEQLKGRPLPDGIVLVPGHAPRLHAFARPEDSCRAGCSLSNHETASGEPSRVALHAFAPVRVSVERGSRSDPDETGPDGIRAAGLHAFAGPEPRRGGLTDPNGDSPIDAFSFIEALGASVAATPLPARMGVLRMRVEPEILDMWRDTVSRFRALSDEPLEDWEVLVLALRRFFQVWDNKETRRQRREHPILERDGWRCAFPGCRSVGTGKLQTHHVLYRSHGGTDDDPGLLIALCNAHHLFLLHQGYIRCSARAPDALVWELGTAGDLPAWRIYRGDVLVGGRAFIRTAPGIAAAV